MKETTTIKIYKETLTKLRLLSALREERMVKLVDRVISQELKKEGGTNEAAKTKSAQKTAGHKLSSDIQKVGGNN